MKKVNKRFSYFRAIIFLFILFLIFSFLGFENLSKYGIVYSVDEKKYIQYLEKDNVKRISLSKNIYLEKERMDKEATNLMVLDYDIEKNQINRYTKRKTNLVPASITKAYSVLYFYDVLKGEDINKQVEAGEEIFLVSEYSSKIGHLKGEKYTLDELFKSSMIKSSADSIYILAKATLNKLEGKELSTPRKNFQFNAEDKKEEANRLFIEEISKKINQYYNQKGYVSVKITDPSGIDRKTIVNDYDIIKMAIEYIKQDYLRDISSTYTEKMLGKYVEGKIDIKNTNDFLNPASTYYNKKVKGIKTGTLKGWNNLVTYYEKGDGKTEINKGHIILVMGAENLEQRNSLTQKVIKNIELVK